MNALAQNPVNALVQGLYGKAQQAADYIGKRYQALKTDPLGDVQKTLQGTIDRGAMRDALHAKAFGNPKNPLEITDPEAFNELMDQAQSDVTSFAPASMLRLGGRQDLIASHGTSASGLLDPRSGRLLPELSHVSLAVQRGQLDNPFAELGKGITLIPKPGKFDPRTSPSVLHSRDAWTPDSHDSLFRQAQSNGATRGLPRAQARTQDRYETRWPKGGENVGIDVDNVVLGNQRFNSFEAFENSKAASQLKTDAREWENAPNAKALFQELNRIAMHRMEKGLDASAQDVLQEILQGLPKSIATAKAQGRVYEINGIDIQKALQEAKNSPKMYAELKSYGQTPLNRDTWAGALYTPGDLMYRSPKFVDTQNKLLTQLQSRGIPTIRQSGESFQDFQLAAELQRRASR